jgi:hypothetical protein
MFDPPSIMLGGGYFTVRTADSETASGRLVSQGLAQGLAIDGSAHQVLLILDPAHSGR